MVNLLKSITVYIILLPVLLIIANCGGDKIAEELTKDTTPPDTPITSQPLNPTNLTSANFSFTSTETGSTFECQIDNSGYTACTSPKNYDVLPEGSHTFEVRAIDTANNTDPTPASYTWTIDITAPSNTTSSNFISGGVTYTNSISVTLSLSATDSLGVTGYYASESSTTPSALATGWTVVTSTTSYSASVSFTLSSGDGTKTVYVWFKDSAGNVSSSASDLITLDTALPTGTTISINSGGVTYTNTTSVTLTLSCTDSGSGCITMLFSNDNLTWTPAGAYTTSSSYTLPAGDGTKTVYVTFKDNAGNWSTATISDDIILDTTAPTAPTGPIFINNDATYTNSTSVTLTLSATDTNGVAEMQFSNDNSTWSTAETYATSKTWTLVTGDGSKTVYVKFKDNAGNWTTATISDSIILDTTAPTGGSISINSGATYKYTNSTSVTLTLLATDTNGVAEMQFSNDNSIWTTAEIYATSKSYTLPTGDDPKTVYVKFKDNAGNWTTTTINDTITLDTTKPTVSPPTSPADNATGVAVNTTITATFSEAMDSTTITTSTFTLLSGGFSGSISYSGTTATFKPLVPLSYNTTYTATITTGVEDLAGNTMKNDYTWSFITKAAKLTWEASITNVDGTTLDDLAGYKVYYGTSSGIYSNSIGVGNVTTYEIDTLSPNTYYFAVTAYDTSGNESDYSNEVSKVIQ